MNEDRPTGKSTAGSIGFRPPRAGFLLGCLVALLTWLPACSGGATPTRSSVTNDELCTRQELKPLAAGAFEVEKVTVQPPTGAEWLPCYEMESNPDRTSVQFLHRRPSLSGTGSGSHTIVVGLSISNFESVLKAVPQWREAQPVDILKEIVARLSSVENRERFRVVEYKTNPQATPGPDCLRFDSVLEDRGVPGQAGRVFILETRGVACFRAGSPASIVIASYGERAPEGEKSVPGLREDGEAYLSSMVFTD